MSKTSTKQRHTQLIEWLSTRKNTTRKTAKTQDNKPAYNMGSESNDMRVGRIKNGPNGRR